MKINIVNLDKDGWILTKFAKNIYRELKKKGLEVFLSKKPKKNVDVNHYIIFLFLKNKKEFFPTNTINTTMLTHVNDQIRYEKIRSTAKFLDAGIAMSEYHGNEIIKKKLGLKKVYHVLPPHDNDQRIKKVNFGIFSNTYSDGRKNEKVLLDVFSTLDTDLFKITIIGKGWKKIVDGLRQKNVEVKYYNFFFRTIYIHEFNKIDYLIYLGNDEGSMTFMDAIQLGIKTIMIPQGFQYDLKELVTHHLKKDLSNLNKILVKILNNKKKFKKYKNNLTWENYAHNHLKIWKEIKMKKNF
jgi:uncharacterized protein with HEPN domain